LINIVIPDSDSWTDCQLAVLSAISVFSMVQDPNPKVVPRKSRGKVSKLVPGEVTAYASKVTRARKSRSSGMKEASDNQVAKETSHISMTNSNAPALTGDSPMPNPKGGGGELFRVWLTLRLGRYRDSLDNKYNGLINLITNPDFLWASYELIKSHPGNMSPGIDKTTLDGLTSTWFLNLASSLKKGNFSFNPARRVMIPKPGKLEKRPLGVGSPREKIVQKALQLILEAIWEPIFSDSSHGFRPKRSIHTALKQVYLNGSRSPWVVQGDISKCFDMIPHDIIMKRLKSHIKCHRSLELIQSSLRAGYLDPGTNKIVKPNLGTPQGSVLSPLLCNIVLHELDQFLEDHKSNFESGTKRKINPEYSTWMSRRQSFHAAIRIQALQEMIKLHSTDQMDPNFRRLLYIRYADDFILLLICTKNEAIMMKNRIKSILKDRCGLTLNDEKTIISNTSDGFDFLGSHIVRPDSVKTNFVKERGHSKRSHLRMRLLAPIAKLVEKLIKHGIAKRNHVGKVYSTARTDLINLSHYEILVYYNSLVNGYLNFYSFVSNFSRLNTICWILRESCALTLALKHKIRTKRRAFNKFGFNLKDKDTGLYFKAPSKFNTTHSFKTKGSINDITNLILNRKGVTKLTESAFGRVCALCGSSNSIEMHHVRSVKDVIHKIRTHTSTFEQWKGAYLRKQVPLCQYHHHLLHEGQLNSADMKVIAKYQFKP